jgi:hypothetical protein
MHGLPAPVNPSTNGSRPELLSDAWPTPTALNRVRDEETMQKCLKFRQGNGQTTVPLYLEERVNIEEKSRPESWLTPRANEPTTDNNFVARNADRGEHCHVSLTTQVKSWATPQQRDFKDAESLAKWTARAEEQKAKGVNLHLPLPSQVMHNEEKANLQTPNCMDTLPPKSQEALDRNREKGGCSNLREWVHHEGTFQMPQTESVLPTPEAYVVRGPIPTEFVDGKFVSLHGEVKYGAKIADAVRVMEEQVKGGNWATPRVSMAQDKQEDSGKCRLGEQAQNKSNGKLNPRWVSVLMNLPVFWTRP